MQTNKQNNCTSALDTNALIMDVFLSSRVQRRIGYRVRRLCKKFDLKKQDREDLTQEFKLALIQAAQSYDPDKGQAGPLITGTLNRRYMKFVNRISLDQRRCFNDAMAYEDIDREFEETVIDPRQYNQLRNCEHRLDIESVLPTLTRKQQRLCRMLMHCSIAQAAEKLGQSRSNVHSMLKTIRKRFSEAGFDSYYFS